MLGGQQTPQAGPGYTLVSMRADMKDAQCRSAAVKMSDGGLSLCKLPRVLHKVLDCSGNGRASDYLSLDPDQPQRKAEVRLPGFGGWLMEKLPHNFLGTWQGPQPPGACVLVGETGNRGQVGLDRHIWRPV